MTAIPLQLQSISLSRGLVDPAGETTVYRMVRQVVAREFPCRLAGDDLLLTTFWVGEPGRYAIRTALTGDGAGAAALGEASQEIELTAGTYVLAFNYGQPVFPAPGVYYWQVYVDGQPVGRFPLPVAQNQT